MTLSNFEIWVGIVAGIATIIAYATGFFKWMWSKMSCIASKSTNYKSSIVIVPQNTQFHDLTTWWHMGKNGSNPAMQVVGNFLVTNAANNDIQLTGAELKKAKVKGQVLVKEIHSQYSSSSYKIPPNGTTDMSINFWIEPPIKQAGQAFSDDVAVVDQFGEKHWIMNVTFRYV